MPGVFRVTAVWNGFAGAPGYSKFSFMDGSTDAVRNAAGLQIFNFFDSIKSLLPNGLTIQVQPSVDELDLISGALLSTAAMTSVPALITSPTAAAAYAAGSGAVVTWLGSQVFAGRRMQGRTFIVPTVGTFETNGTLTSTALTTLKTAADALIAAAGADLAIWSRSWTKPPDPLPSSWKPTPTAGHLGSATAAVVRDMASQMRSRRS